jgi:hypothetical protein
MPLPTVTSGLQWWFDARDITGVSDGSTISSWNDSSGNSHTATVSTGSATYHTNQYNGGAALTLASCRMAISGSVTSTGVHTIFAVFKLSATSGDQVLCGQNGTSGINYRLVQSNGGSARLQFAWADSGTGMEGTGTAAPDTSWHYANMGQNSSLSLDFRLDGAADTFIAGSSLSAGTAAPITIGGTGAGEYLIGQLQVLGYYNRLLTLTERQAVESGLSTPVVGPARQPQIFVVT